MVKLSVELMIFIVGLFISSIGYSIIRYGQSQFPDDVPDPCDRIDTVNYSQAQIEKCDKKTRSNNIKKIGFIFLILPWTSYIFLLFQSVI
jgi:hypothetical protein